MYHSAITNKISSNFVFIRVPLFHDKHLDIIDLILIVVKDCPENEEELLIIYQVNAVCRNKNK